LINPAYRQASNRCSRLILSHRNLHLPLRVSSDSPVVDTGSRFPNPAPSLSLLLFILTSHNRQHHRQEPERYVDSGPSIAHFCLHLHREQRQQLRPRRGFGDSLTSAAHPPPKVGSGPCPGRCRHGSCPRACALSHARILRYEAHFGGGCFDHTLSVCLLILANDSAKRC
jgi:hypothetical protein